MLILNRSKKLILSVKYIPRLRASLKNNGWSQICLQHPAAVRGLQIGLIQFFRVPACRKLWHDPSSARRFFPTNLFITEFRDYDARKAHLPIRHLTTLFWRARSFPADVKLFNLFLSPASVDTHVDRDTRKVIKIPRSVIESCEWADRIDGYGLAETSSKSISRRQGLYPFAL